MIIGFARAFAQRLHNDHPTADLATTVENAYVATFGRGPSQEETDAAVAFIELQQKLIAERHLGGDAVEIPQELPKSTDSARMAAIVDFCHALLNANEFIYFD